MRAARVHVRLADVVRTAMELSRPEIVAGRIAVDITIDPPHVTAWVDAGRFAQVIREPAEQRSRVHAFRRSNPRHLSRSEPVACYRSPR
jgi:hypothetical protein